MSISDTPIFRSTPANGLFQQKTITGMALTLGLTVSAIVITAGHHIAVEEGRGLLNRFRSSRTMRRERNNAILCALLASDDIPVHIIKYLEEQRDVFRAAIRLSIDEEVAEDTRIALRSALRDLYTVSNGMAK
jgi:hypothetical protein